MHTPMFTTYDCEDYPVEDSCCNKNVVTKIEFSGEFTRENISSYISKLNEYENCRLFVFNAGGSRAFDIDCIDLILAETGICGVQTPSVSPTSTPRKRFLTESWV